MRAIAQEIEAIESSAGQEGATQPDDYASGIFQSIGQSSFQFSIVSRVLT